MSTDVIMDCFLRGVSETADFSLIPSQALRIDLHYSLWASAQQRKRTAVQHDRLRKRCMEYGRRGGQLEAAFKANAVGRDQFIFPVVVFDGTNRCVLRTVTRSESDCMAHPPIR
jgi:hypothetical protein